MRFVGDSIAAVAATDRHIAEEALGLIEVEYEQLPFVLEPEEALEEGPRKFMQKEISVLTSAVSLLPW
ncbi:MAG: hypothetical protein CM1200mP40_35700 [Gammaproteobacteria bacterium]|nr:MAG: hypothetical protein CM1200mP40_35700 [Gammaproteobacteria bacterium]